MRKVSLVFAMVIAAGMAMAQPNEATIAQTGNDHASTITQGGNLNLAFVTQTADLPRFGLDLGTATVVQDGTENLVRIQQRAFYGDAYASITQMGYQNKVYGLTAADNFLQNHGDNRLVVYMKGNVNTLKSLASEAQKNINIFDLSVKGSYNTTAMSQHFGVADVDIEGDRNGVTVKQVSGQPAGLSDTNEADIDIMGNSNTVSVDQSNLNNMADVNIEGGNNTGSVVQNGSTNEVFMSQVGNNHNSSVNQLGNLNHVQSAQQIGDSNTATFIQTGDNNNVYSWQTESNSKLKLVEEGNLNVVSLWQTNGSTADIFQDGNNNKLDGDVPLSPSSIIGYSMNGSNLDLDQIGNLNTLHLFQDHAGSATVTQTGNSNTSSVSQN